MSTDTSRPRPGFCDFAARERTRLRRRRVLVGAAVAPVLVGIAVAASVALGGEAMAPEAALGALGDPRPGRRARARAVLLDEGEDAVRPLSDLVRAGRPPHDVEAARVLADLARAGTDVHDAIEALDGGLREGSPDLARGCAVALGASGRLEAIHLLIEALAAHPDPARRRIAADALGEAREPRAVAALHRALAGDPPVAGRARAAMQLILGPDAGVPAPGAPEPERERWWRAQRAGLPEQILPRR